MKIKNISQSNALIPEIKDKAGRGLMIYPNQELVIYDEDAEKSPTLAQYIIDGIIEKTGMEEPLEGLDLFVADDTKKTMKFPYPLEVVPIDRPVGNYAYLSRIDDGDGLMKGGAVQKTYALGITVGRPVASVATGDSNDAILKASYNNYAPNDANFIVRGVNMTVNNRDGGTLGMLDHLLGSQGKSGGTVQTIRGLTIVPENYGTVSAEFGGVIVQMKNEGAVATTEYGVKVQNINNSLATKVKAAFAAEVPVKDPVYVNQGFITGLDLSGCDGLMTNEVVFSNGIKVTVSGDTVVLTNAAATKSITLTLV